MADIDEVRQVTNAAGTLAASYRDEQVREQYDIRLNPTTHPTGSSDLQDILVSAASPTAGVSLPQRYDAWPTSPTYGLYAKQFQFVPKDEEKRWYECTITYMPLEPGEQIKGEDPLKWAPEYRVDYVEEEFQVQEARNVEAFTGGFGRKALTLGPVLNTAFEQLTEPIMEIDRHPVLRIKRNVRSLETVINFNSAFNLTTNSTDFFGAGPRQAKFLVAEGGDRQELNGVEFYEMVTSVAIQKTTDREVENVGWKHFRQDAGQPDPNNPPAGLIPWEKVLAKVLDEQQLEEGVREWVPASEPVPLALSGKKAGSLEKITYRYLEEVDYNPLIVGLPP